ncbi:MAG: sphingomyelin phosphodiesterase [Crocinitomicaceae bacterium]|nr:sphingomyelin phosphodiesterase [Crocinitomicaceae bacterium]
MKILTVLIILLLANNFSFAQSSDSLKVVSWNVFLRPSILKDGQLDRVDSIAASILKMDADVVVLQEVFHKRSRRKLIKTLSDSYPYHTKMGRRTFWGVPSGNLILSKDSIESQQFIYYKRAMKADKLAKKGAIAVKIKHAEKSFKVYGTHLQAGGGHEGAKIRCSQIDQLASMSEPGEETTSVFAGDFNIRYGDTLYNYLSDKLNIDNIVPVNKELGTANFNDHDLTNASGSPKWIDFIFLHRANGIRFRVSRIKEPRCLFKKKRSRISDHNPLITVFDW